MKKLLITGLSSFLGWHLAEMAQTQGNSPVQPAPDPLEATASANPGWQVYGTYHSRPVQLAGVTAFPLDLTDFASLKLIIQSLRPDAVLHVAALSSPNACQSQPELSHQINVIASCNLAGLCADAQIPCLFTSSEQVFDGRQPPYRETDPVCPINTYGEHKAAAEAGMQARWPQVAICRLPLLFGVAPADSFIQPWIRSLRAGKPLDLFTDEIRNPAWAKDVAVGMFLALAQVQGIIHLGGPERISRYELGRLLAEVLQISDPLLNPRRQSEVTMAAPRPPDVTLDSSLAFSLGYCPHGLRQALTLLKPQL
ncbi:MAG: SDR family oxidoreductase [Elainella sp.]